jgi:hypothetical protein
LAPANVDRVDPPPFARAADIAGHSPAQPALNYKRWQVHHRRDEATRVAAPCLTAANRAATVNADRAVIAAYKEGAPSIKDILVCLALVNADLQNAAVKAEIGIHVRRFKIKVLPEG